MEKKIIKIILTLNLLSYNLCDNIKEESLCIKESNNTISKT